MENNTNRSYPIFCQSANIPTYFSSKPTKNFGHYKNLPKSILTFVVDIAQYIIEFPLISNYCTINFRSTWPSIRIKFLKIRRYALSILEIISRALNELKCAGGGGRKERKSLIISLLRGWRRVKKKNRKIAAWFV